MIVIFFSQPTLHMYGQACIHKTELFISKFEVYEIAVDIFLLFFAKFTYFVVVLY